MFRDSFRPFNAMVGSVAFSTVLTKNKMSHRFPQVAFTWIAAFSVLFGDVKIRQSKRTFFSSTGSSLTFVEHQKIIFIFTIIYKKKILSFKNNATTMFCLINCYFDFYVQYVNVFLRCIVVLVIVDEIDVELGVELAIVFVLELNWSSLSVFDWTFSSWNKLDNKANIF